MPFHVYVLADQPRGKIYVGITNDLGRRLVEHREGRGSDYARQHGLHLLVYAETFDIALDAIAAEKRIKKWRRAWKIAMVERSNPSWDDLAAFIH